MRLTLMVSWQGLKGCGLSLRGGHASSEAVLELLQEADIVHDSADRKDEVELEAIRSWYRR
jgi:hypothetical protein